MNVDVNWWEHFFTGAAVDLWLEALTPEHTRAEADRIERFLGLAAGAEMLDVPCGAGRLTLDLAGRGYRMTGVDLSAEFLGHARAADAVGEVNWEQRDMRDLPWPARFDGAFCFGNSFGYLDDQGDAQFLRAVAAALKPGGRFVLETPMIVESVLRHVKERDWFKVGDTYLIVSNDYDWTRGRLDTNYTFVADGRVETRRGTHRAYTYRQLIELMTASGFAVTLAEPWQPANPMLTLIGTRIDPSADRRRADDVQERNDQRPACDLGDGHERGGDAAAPTGSTPRPPGPVRHSPIAARHPHVADRMTSALSAGRTIAGGLATWL